MSVKDKVSVVIPVYNEEKMVSKLLDSFSYNGNFEVIIADGGSTDRTLEITKKYPVRVVECNKGRALQMNRAAEVAAGDILLFLHCDCRLEEGSIEAIRDFLNAGNVGGCLTHRITAGGIIYRFIEASGNIRAKISRIFYGDQAIFARREIFFKLGGFDRVGLFEDVLFSQKLKKEGRTAILNKKVYTLPRRWQKEGIIKTILLYWVLTLGFLFGVSTYTLEKLYSDVR